jgi:hypothetical protein
VGEVAELADTINNMTDTRHLRRPGDHSVAREVGVGLQLKSGQGLLVPGRSRSTWKGFGTDKSISLAGRNPTTQVMHRRRGLQRVTKGDPSPGSITVAAQGEVAALKDNNINEMIATCARRSRTTPSRTGWKTNLAAARARFRGQVR